MPTQPAKSPTKHSVFAYRTFLRKALIQVEIE